LTSRAKRRDDARIVAKAAEQAGGATLDIVAELAATKRDLGLAISYTKSYKTRLERVLMGLQLVSNFIVKNEIQAAQTAVRSLLANDAKEAREAVGNRREALRIAVEALEINCNPQTRPCLPLDPCVGHAAIRHIKTLCPEQFGGEVEMTAPTASEVKS
jgi:hypothetical protein